LEFGIWNFLTIESRTVQFSKSAVRITLNGDPYDLDQPLSMQELLERLDIDPVGSRSSTTW
jgi:hypothetical protein